MCGICGILVFQDQGAVLPELVQKMSSRIRHRGPDDEGTYSGDRVALGHRRLAIIDLSSAGRQPMEGPDGCTWIVHNGEIYNYRELRADLMGRGHRFRSQTDTEVILHAYQEYEVGCLRHFNGMFAFAIWDSNRRQLFLARDRLGIKPLYYYRDRERFLFASEIKAILAAHPGGKSPNYPLLKEFLLRGLLDHSQETLFQGIHQVPPAHFLLVSPDSLRLERYWDFEEQEAAERYDYDHPPGTFRSLLEDAVRLQLRADVPVGTCLSGGLDSTTLVALASSMLDHPMRSFSAVFEDEGYDERRYVELASAAFKTDGHLVRPTPPSPSAFFDTLSRITWYMDEPTDGPGVYAQWFVMQEARGKVKVLLDGQGGDELLGGYYRYFLDYPRSLWRRFLTRRDLRYLARLGADILPIARTVVANYLHMGFRAFAWKLIHRVRTHREKGPGPSVLHPDFEGGIPSLPHGRRVSHCADPLNDHLYWDLVRDTIPAMLHYEDRNSMAHGIEARVPLLDHRLVEFCLGLPPEWKIRGDRTKVLLREAMADRLPAEIVGRREKMGYRTPLALWLGREDFYHAVQEFLLSNGSAEPPIFDAGKVARLLETHRSRRRDLSWEIWRWMSCKMWFRRFFCGGGP